MGKVWVTRVRRRYFLVTIGRSIDEPIRVDIRKERERFVRKLALRRFWNDALWWLCQYLFDAR